MSSPVPGSIGKDWRLIEEFFCCKCEMVYSGDDVMVCEHGEAFDCCTGCGMILMGLSCEGLQHQIDWTKERT